VLAHWYSLTSGRRKHIAAASVVLVLKFVYDFGTSVRTSVIPQE
jgi:hypothetical protein